jgi:hypothetical protein
MISIVAEGPAVVVGLAAMAAGLVAGPAAGVVGTAEEEYQEEDQEEGQEEDQELPPVVETHTRGLVNKLLGCVFALSATFRL